MSSRRPASLDGLATQAEELARARGERPNTAHLLAVLLEGDGLASELLPPRTIRDSLVLEVASAFNRAEVLKQAVDRAIEMARSMRAAQVNDVHLLLALMNSRDSAAHRALTKSNADLPRLRALAINAGLGLVRRRATLAGKASVSAVKPSPIQPQSAAREPEPPGAVLTRVESKTRASEPASRAGGHRRDKRSSKGSRSRFTIDGRRSKLLAAMGQNLTLLAEQAQLPEVVGREREVEQLFDVLAKREANCPCLVGTAGVGKTSVVHALAARTACPESLPEADRRIIVELPIGELLAGTGARGALSQRLLQLRRELVAYRGRVVIFLDDVHQLFVADPGDELMIELKRALSSEEFLCIGATSPQAFAQFVETDAGLHRRFARVDVAEPDADAASEILELAARRLGAHHRVEYNAEAIASAIAWSARYIPRRALPEKALSVIDLAGARCQRRGEGTVGCAQVAAVVSELASVPYERLMESDGERLLRLEATMAERVVGHDEQIRSICRIIRRNAAGLHGRRPIGTFLLLGPTGVGKTETAKAVSEILFGSEQAMTRLDLSEYSEPHSVARLIGAPPGYVGFEAGGQLTEAVRQRPYQVLLLDEIEKAHPEVLATFLPLFDEGRLTDGRGTTVDFTNVVIFLTSNLGAREATSAPSRRVGFGQSASEDDGKVERADRVVAAARARLSPEFFNRIDESLVFSALTTTEVEEIARRLLQRLADDMFEQRGVELSIEQSVIQCLLEQGGFDGNMGARPMRRAIARLIEAPLAEALLRGDFLRGSRVRLWATGGCVAMQAEVEAAE